MTDQLTVTYGIEYPKEDGTELVRFTEDMVARWDSRGEAEMAASWLEPAHSLPMKVVEVLEGSVLQ